jgi:hypothetical protein
MKIEKSKMKTPRLAVLIGVACVTAMGCTSGLDALPLVDEVASTSLESTFVDVLPAPPLAAPTVDDAIRMVAASAKAFTTCVQNASVDTLARCNESYVQSIADILHVTLPNLPCDALMSCAASGVECTLASDSIDALGICATDLIDCADETEAVLRVVDSLKSCAEEKISCLGKTGDAGVNCGEKEVACVASGLGVTLPEKGFVVDRVICAEQAVECVANSLRLSEIAACASRVTACASDVTEETASTDETPQISECIMLDLAAIGLVEGAVAIGAPLALAMAAPVIDCAAKLAGCIIIYPANFVTCVELMPAICR